MAHEFDGIKACGSWIIAELMGERGTTGDGKIMLPQGSGVKQWTVISVGPLAGDICCVGDWVYIQTFPYGMTPPAVSIDKYEGRTFVLLRPEQVIGVLEKHAAPALVEPSKADLKLVRPS